MKAGAMNFGGEIRTLLFRYWCERKLPERGFPNWWWQSGIYLLDETPDELELGTSPKVVRDDGKVLDVKARVRCGRDGVIANRDLWALDDRIDRLVESMKPDGELK